MAVKTNAIALASLCFLVRTPPARAQVLDSLAALDDRIAVHQNTGEGIAGPKGIVAADFDRDGRADFATASTFGRVSVFFNRGNDQFDETFLDATTSTLRDIIAGEWSGDDLPDIVATAPFLGQLLFFKNLGGRAFAQAETIPTWVMARNLATGDFNGDGLADLFVAGNIGGGRQYRGSAGGGLRVVADFPELSHDDPLGVLPGWLELKPVYTIASFRPAGSTRDELLVVNADGRMLNGYSGAAQLVPDVDGILRIAREFPLDSEVHGLQVGNILRPISEAGPADLVTLHSDPLEEIQIHRGTPGPERFEPATHQRIFVPGGPRAAAIVDLDGDGWNDLAVAVRNQDKVIALRNVNGSLSIASETPSGVSPREIVAADFSGDGTSDIALINRVSSDVSLLPGIAGTVGFATLDAVYRIEGDISDLALVDLTGDERAETLLLDRASGDLSVMTSDTAGYLGPPKRYGMGRQPSSLVLLDVDEDGDIDVAAGALSGSTGILALRLGDGIGGFGPLKEIPIPGLHPSSYIFSVKAFDFDGDGLLDLAVGIYDCSGSRIVFLRGQGETSFAQANVVPFPRARGMGLADFDGDGDVDFAAVSALADLVVLENKGSLLRADSIEKTSYVELQQLSLYPSGFEVKDVDANNDPDLVIDTQRGVVTYIGGEGMGFKPVFAERQPDMNPFSYGLAPPVIADFDEDGHADLATPQFGYGTIVIYFGAKDAGEPFSSARSRTFKVPGSNRLATGDLDGDGRADLAGTGEFLWTALSSRRPKLGNPPAPSGGRERIPKVLINEILAINNDLGSPLEEDAGKNPDWVEIYGGQPEPRSLAGWRLVLTEPGTDPRGFTFPDGASLDPGAYRLVIYSNTVRSPYHTGFKLPGDGAKLELIDEKGAVVDSVEYARQFQNASYGRFEDAVAAFAFQAQPSPGRPNRYAGGVPPEVELTGVEFRRTGDGYTYLTLEARGRDDSGFASVGIEVRATGIEAMRVELEDVTSHDEESSGARRFRRELALWGGNPLGIMEFFVDAVDLSGVHTTVPEDATFSRARGSEDSPPELLRFALDAEDSIVPRLQISEVVPLNESGIADESGEHADWLEIQNCSEQAVDLSRFRISKSMDPKAESLQLPAMQLPPGGFLVVFCDGEPGEGLPHAPFHVDADDDNVFLFHVGVPGGDASLANAPVIVDSVAVRGLEADVAWARSGCRGEWSRRTPTPGAANDAVVVERGDVNLDRRLDVSDPVVLLQYLFQGAAVECPGAGDVNSDHHLGITDAIRILRFLFQGGAPLEGGQLLVSSCEAT